MKQNPNFGKETNRVYQTTEYSKFKFRDDNRTINPNHVKNISRKMKSNGWFSGSYVIVNNKFEIIDGQHRVKAAMLANVPINYIMEKNTGFESIRNLNSNQKNWNMGDHIHGYVAENNSHYVNLYKFMNEFPELKITECMMLCKNQYVAIPRNTFEGGEFTVNDMDIARKWGNHIMELKKYFPKGYNRSIFVRALVRILSKKPNFIFEEFIHKVKLRPTSLVPCGTTEQYVELIETIYNYRRQEKVNLRY
jgi:hypothetical protein